MGGGDSDGEVGEMMGGGDSDGEEGTVVGRRGSVRGGRRKLLRNAVLFNVHRRHLLNSWVAYL